LPSYPTQNRELAISFSLELIESGVNELDVLAPELVKQPVVDIRISIKKISGKNLFIRENMPLRK